MTKQQLQQKAGLLNEENFERFSKGQNEFLSKTIFEGELPSEEDFAHFRQFSMAHRSEAYLDITFEYWNYLAFGKLSEGNKYCFRDIVTYITSSQMLSLVDWIRWHGQKPESLSDYTKYRLSVEKMENYINPLIDIFTNDLLDELIKIQGAIIKAPAGTPISKHRAPVKIHRS